MSKDVKPSPPQRCPACGYDIEHIDSDRCPECGVVLDRAALRAFGEQANATLHGVTRALLIPPLVVALIFAATGMAMYDTPIAAIGWFVLLSYVYLSIIIALSQAPICINARNAAGDSFQPPSGSHLVFMVIRMIVVQLAMLLLSVMLAAVVHGATQYMM